MTVAIALLRGVNVGGHGKIAMETLRDICAGLGLRDVRTYIQSGNVVFSAPARALKTIAARIEQAVEERAGFRRSVIVRTAAELEAIVAGSPLAARPGLDPAKIAVAFLASEPPPEAWAKALALPAAPDEVHPSGREVFFYFPNGIGQARLPMPAFERALGVAATSRNWTTVGKLLAMTRGA